jgi:hypothetical protein
VDDVLRRTTIALALPALVVALAAGAALAAVTYPDPSGDVKAGAGPDLTAVTVSHTPRLVTFRVRFATAPPLRLSVAQRWVDMLLIGIDVPPRGLRRGPQDWRGVDFAAGLHGAQKTAVVVNQNRRAIVARVPVVMSGRTLSFSIGRRALGDPAWLDFVVTAAREQSDESAVGGEPDVAPSRGVFHYRLTG